MLVCNDISVFGDNEARSGADLCFFAVIYAYDTDGNCRRAYLLNYVVIF